MRENVSKMTEIHKKYLTQPVSSSVSESVDVKMDIGSSWKGSSSENKNFIKIWPFVWLVLLLLSPSLYVIQKYLGAQGLVFYVLFVPVTVFFVLRNFLPFFTTRMSEKQAFLLTLMFLACLVVIFFIVFPKANVPLPGQGSDSDDGLNLAVQELLNLRYPYNVRAYLGNPISEFPGAIMLSMPFLMMGNSAYQNIFWIILFCMFLKLYLKTWRLVFPLMLLLFVLSPEVVRQLVTGGPILANEIFVMLSMYLIVSQLSGTHDSTMAKIGSAVFLGIAMSSRLNFVLVGPLLLSCLVQNSGWKQTVKYLLISLLVWSVVTLPFYFYSSGSFTPLIAQADKASHSALPYSVILLPLVGGMISVILAMRRMGPDCEALFGYSALVQGLLVVAVVILSNLSKDKIDLFDTRYGIMFLFLGCVPCWRVLTREWQHTEHIGGPEN